MILMWARVNQHSRTHHLDGRSSGWVLIFCLFLSLCQLAWTKVVRLAQFDFLCLPSQPLDFQRKNVGIFFWTHLTASTPHPTTHLPPTLVYLPTYPSSPTHLPTFYTPHKHEKMSMNPYARNELIYAYCIGFRV
jgi:hypothetical protein